MKIKLLRLFMTAALLLCLPNLNYGQAPNLGAASSFAMFTAAGAFTSNGATTVTGDIGNYTGAVNSTPATLNGNKHFGDSTAFHAAADVATAYAALKAMTCSGVIGTTMGSAQTITPGVYCTGGSTTLGGTVTFDAGGNANAIFVIQIDGAFATGSQVNIALKNSASSCNIYWQVNGAVAIGDTSIFRGTIIAAGQITTGATTILYGRGLSTAGAITLNASTITMGCSTPIVITKQPSSIIACAGSAVSYSVTATGNNLTYQWRKGSTNLSNGGHISGATTATLKINPATAADVAATYNVIISGSGSPNDTSVNVSLLLNEVTAATVSGQTVCAGNNAVFTVSQTSTGPAAITYQWQVSTNGGTSYTNISGATTSSYTVSSPATTSDNFLYHALVSSGACSSFTSTAGTLRVNGISAATVAGKATCSGTDAVFTVSSTSTGPASLSYQWQLSTNGGTTFSNISGATTSSYTVTAPGSSSDNYQYKTLVSSGSCASFISTAGTLRVNNVSAASVANLTVCSGNDAVFTVSQTSTGSAGLNYQWMLSTNGGTTFSNISGATSASYTVTAPGASSDLYQYESVVASGSCGAFTSTAGTLRVNAVTTATILGQTVCSGTDATFSVFATNSGPASLKYQWKESTNGGTTYSNITGATGTSYVVTTPGASSDNYLFENIVTSGSCAAFASNSAALRVNAVTSATIAGQTVCSGNNAGFTVSVSHTGPASLSYQWKMSTDKGTTFSDISGATNATYTESSTGAASDSNLYECIVTSGTCNPFTSTIATLRVNAITSAVVSNEIVCSATNATFSVTVINTGSVSLSYQWMRSINNGSTFTIISGATASDYTVSAPGPTFDNYQYKCIVRSGSCASDTSTAGILRVNSVTGALVASQIVCSGADAVFNSYVINTGSGVLSYQWKISTNGGASFSNITNTNSASYTVASPDGSYDNNEYEFTVASASCPAFSSTAAILRVNGAVSAPVLNHTVCASTDAVFVSSPTSTGPASLTYQWQLSSDGGLSFSDIKGAKDTLYTVIAPDATSDNYQYRNLITSGTCPAYTSSVGVLSVNDITASTVASQSVCSGFDATFTNNVTSTGPAFLTYQWKRSTDGGVTFIAIPGATGTTFTVAAPTSTSDGYLYENIVTSAGCMSYTSDAGMLSINAAPNIIGGPENACVCVYTNASFWVNATGTDLRYQWRRGDVNLVDSGRITGSNTDVLTINGVIIYDTAANYNVIVMGTCSPNDTSSNVVLSLCKQSSISSANAGKDDNTISIFPNPFTSSASVSFIASKSENVNASVYNVSGEKIETLYDGSVVANNTYTYELKGAGLTPGIYFVRLTSQSNVQYVKVMKLKD